MTQTADELLGFKIGPQTVAENLSKAVASAALLQHEDGSYELAPAKEGVSPWLHVVNGPSLDCQFKMRFLFDHAYGQKAVPLGCQNCYKVGVTPKSLSQLMALKAVQADMGLKSKCGVEVDRETTQNLYSGFFYCEGLDGARSVYQQARLAIDSHPELGPEVAMRIKRGCTEYELHCGPSDQFTFAPELEKLERHLSSQFVRPVKSTVNPLKAKLSTLARWISTAFRIGDDSYLEFTRGKRLYPRTVTYEPSSSAT